MPARRPRRHRGCDDIRSARCPRRERRHRGKHRICPGRLADVGGFRQSAAWHFPCPHREPPCARRRDRSSECQGRLHPPRRGRQPLGGPQRPCTRLRARGRSRVRGGQREGLPPGDQLRDPRRSGADVTVPLPGSAGLPSASQGEKGVVVSGSPQGMPTRDPEDRVAALLAHADDNLVLAQRLGEWISKAPDLEIDIALGNIALDHLGVARALYGHAGSLEGEGRGEDDLAMGRDEREYLNLLLVEQPNGDFAHTMVRQLFFDAYQTQLWEDLAADDDPVVAGIAAKAAKETAYHLQYSASWVIRLGAGTDESHRRAQAALDALWRFTEEVTADDRAGYRPAWERLVGSILAEATLKTPQDPYQRTGGRNGYHTEHLGYLLAEMQWMQRSNPGLEW